MSGNDGSNILKWVIGIVILLIVIAIVIFIIWWFWRFIINRRPRKLNRSREVITSNAIQTFSGSSGSRRIVLYWYTQNSGLYTIQTVNNLQYGCFSSSTTLSGSIKVLFYIPEYSGPIIPLPNINACDNIVTEPIASVILSTPSVLGTSTVNVTSVKTSALNDFALVQGESFTLSRV